MKTICFVVPMYPAISETFITNQIVEAKMKGYKVLVLTHRLGSIEQSSQQGLVEKHAILKDTIVIDYKIPKSKLKRLFVGLFPIVRYFKYWIRKSHASMRHRVINLPFLLKFYNRLRHVDVIHIQFAAGGRDIAEMIEIGLIRAKVITTFHGHDAHYTNEKELKSLQDLYRVLFKVSDFVTVNTPYLGTKVTALGCEKDKLHVIHMGVDVAYFKSNLPKQFPVKQEIKLISIGRLIEFKGFEYAINAVKLLVDKGTQVHYTIVGEGRLFESLIDQIQSLKLEKHVLLVEKKNQNEIKNLLEMNHVFLMSSITDRTGRSESQGVVTAEAQAMGLPVVAFNNGGIPYTIRDGETGVLVDEKDVAAYAKAILELISHSDRYQMMSEQAREFASAEFSNSLMSKQFMKLYDN